LDHSDAGFKVKRMQRNPQFEEHTVKTKGSFTPPQCGAAWIVQGMETFGGIERVG